MLRKVEKPSLGSPEISALEFHNAIPRKRKRKRKRKRIPSTRGVLSGSDDSVTAKRSIKNPQNLVLKTSDSQFVSIEKGNVYIVILLVFPTTFQLSLRTS
ncbi:MAG: hypothetical protein HQ498_11900 [Pseudohongiella sp.]|nr:hypothetical protein [Pseudohongiella sp.]